MTEKRWTLTARLITLAVFGAATIYKLANVTGYGTSGFMFIGIPAALAVIVTFSPNGKSSTATVLKATTLLLLLAGILLVEGVVCILMAAPLVYLVAIGVGKSMDHAFNEGGREWPARVTILVPLLLVATQGSFPVGDLSRDVDGVAVRIVDMTPAEVADAFDRPPDFDDALPALFRYGQFPRPLSCRITGDRMVIDFEMLEPSRHKMTSGGHHEMSSQLVLERSVSEPGRIVFEPVSDTTMMSQWATLTSSSVEWTAVGDQTRVEWTIHAQRKLDPAWYFGPMQNYAAQRAADYLITAVLG